MSNQSYLYEASKASDGNNIADQYLVEMLAWYKVIKMRLGNSSDIEARQFPGIDINEQQFEHAEEVAIVLYEHLLSSRQTMGLGEFENEPPELKEAMKVQLKSCIS